MDTFSSKVLLFGEYSVIQHSNALAMPYHLFEGRLTFGKEKSGSRDPELQALVRYMKKLEDRSELDFDFDVSSFGFDVSQGLVFDSTIPQGYGVGSSGALIAALYHRYCQKREDFNGDIDELKNRLALLESHFHGASSGFDPLVSYLNQSIFKDKKEGLSPVTLKENIDSPSALFLLNTGRSRKTEPLVNLFLEKCKSEEFSFLCEQELVPITNKCIENFRDGNLMELWDSFYALSRFQYENFKPMIPKLYHDLWEQGLENKNFLLKICGAGGGGFLMGLTKNFKDLTKELDSFELRHLFKI
jgi:mevalonate kinase